MTARHARSDDAVPPVVSPLRLVDDDPRDPGFTPEVRAVLEAAAALHTALIGWAATTAEHDEPRPGGRHRR